jgi:competence protein ComEA
MGSMFDEGAGPFVTGAQARPPKPAGAMAIVQSRAVVATLVICLFGGLGIAAPIGPNTGIEQPLDAGNDAAAERPGTDASHLAESEAGSSLDLNLATVDDLCQLPTIGPKRARQIIELRQKLGTFRHVDDLLRVRGIGRNSMKRLRPLVRVHPVGRLQDSGSDR